MIRSIDGAAAEMRLGRLSALALLEECLERIDRLEPRVHAWVLVDRAGARAEAERLDAELQAGHDRGPLHGIPLGIKDIIDVFDWPTAAGSRLWAQSKARHDAAVVQRLRQGGAVLLGKTVTTQYASFDPPPTRNPWNPGRTPGGSSSGSAAAVACGMCLGALGSQTGGSLTRPASYCGVASIKPTLGRVSTDGVVPLAPSLDHVGPMAGCVRGLALLLQAIAGPDASEPNPGTCPVPDMVTRLAAPLRAPRLGRPGGLFEEQAEPVMRSLMGRISDNLQAAGASVVNVALASLFTETSAAHRTIMAVEAAAYHGPRLRRYPDDYLPNIRALLEEGLACPAAEYARCREHQARLGAAILHCFDGVDALLTPAATGPAPDALTTGNPAFNSPWSYTGLPVVSLPAGWSPEGLPLAIQLVGKPWAEAELLATAAWCEATLKWERREPTLG